MAQQGNSPLEDVITDADTPDRECDPEDRARALPPRRGTVRWGALTTGVAAAAVAGTWLYRRFGGRSNT